jgi:hypothetical protein
MSKLQSPSGRRRAQTLGAAGEEVFLPTGGDIVNTIGKVLCAEKGIRVYGLNFRRRMLMKATRWDEVISGSTRVSRQKSTPPGSDESLFSLLLKFESRLQRGLKGDFQLGSGRRKPSKLKLPQRSIPGNLSRYIE